MIRSPRSQWHLPSLLAVLLLQSCAFPFTETLQDIIADSYAPTFSLLEDTYGLTPTYELTMDFDQEMDVESLTLGGTMAEEAEYNWFDVNTVLFIRPKTTWSSRKDATLIVSCKDTNGYSCEASRGYGILDGAVCVSPAGSASGSGRSDDPKSSIADAIVNADKMSNDNGPVEVHVAEGTYSMDEALEAKDMRLKLYGGYSLDFSERDASLHPTILSWAGTDTIAYALSLEGCDKGTVIDGFTMSLSGSQAASCVYLSDSEALITHNSITIYDQGDALSVNGSTATIEDNTFCGYTDATILYCSDSTASITGNVITSNYWWECDAVGIYASTVTFEGNEIRMSGGGTLSAYDGSHGLYIEGCSPMIRNNVIDAGIGGKAYCIYNVSSSPAIQNNTLYVGCGMQYQYGTGSKACVICNATGTSASQPSIVNNLIFASGENALYGISNADAGSAAAEIRNNCFSGLPSAETVAYNGVDGNLVVSDLAAYMERPSWKLVSSTPSSITAGALDMSATFTMDKAGVTRAPGAWSMGAYQCN